MKLSSSKRLLVMAGFATFLFAGLLHAEDTHAKMGKGKMEMTAEQRKQMADMHEKMATCLRSTKPMEECRKEMMSSCKEMGDSCPMMGKMHGHHMMHDKDMDSDKESSEHK